MKLQEIKSNQAIKVCFIYTFLNVRTVSCFHFLELRVQSLSSAEIISEQPAVPSADSISRRVELQLMAAICPSE